MTTDGGRQLVAWCAGCEMYLPVEDAGTRCPGDDCDRTLRKRIGYICRSCDVHPIFFRIDTYRAHLEEERIKWTNS